MIVRERLTGEQPPPTARKLVDLWRPMIEDRAGRNLDRLERVLNDQRRFGDVVHDLLDNLDMGEDRKQRRPTRRKAKTATRRTARDESGAGRRCVRFRRQRAHEPGRGREPRPMKSPESASEAIDAPSAEMADDAEMGDSETAAEPWRPRHLRNEPLGPDYRPLRCQIRRDRRRRGSLRAGRARTPARLSRQAAVAPAGRGRTARQPPAAAVCWRSRTAPGSSIWKRACWIAARLSRVIVDPLHPLSFKREKDTRLPRHGGDAAARQFRLDARAADHGGGDLRRHSGAHAGTLRRQGRDSGLHHPRVEGRAVARGLARRRASRPIPAASTICATSSTSRRTRPGGGRARISA